MAVFTQVSPAEVHQLLRRIDPNAQLHALEPIGTGIENTNYFVDAELALPQEEGPNARLNPADPTPPAPQQRLVLTLFETHSADDVQIFGGILTWWAQQGFPVPAPVRAADGIFLNNLQGKPAFLSPRLPGNHVVTPEACDSRTRGRLLGQMHLVPPQAPFSPPVRRDLAWMRHAQHRLTGQLPSESPTRLSLEIEHYARQQDLL